MPSLDPTKRCDTLDDLMIEKSLAFFIERMSNTFDIRSLISIWHLMTNFHLFQPR